MKFKKQFWIYLLAFMSEIQLLTNNIEARKWVNVGCEAFVTLAIISMFVLYQKSEDQS